MRGLMGFSFFVETEPGGVPAARSVLPARSAALVGSIRAFRHETLGFQNGEGNPDPRVREPGLLGQFAGPLGRSREEAVQDPLLIGPEPGGADRKSTRLNSSHLGRPY